MQQDSSLPETVDTPTPGAPPPAVIARVTITWRCCHCETVVNVESGPILMQMLRGLGATLNCPRKECAKPLTVAPEPKERMLVQPAKTMPTNREGRRALDSLSRRGLIHR